MAKAISERRDRRQSAALVGLVGLLLLAETAAALRLALPELRTFPAHVAGAIAISVLFAMAVRLARAATTPAAICGGMICLVLTSRTGWLAEPVWRSALTPLACLFALTFAATRAGGERKRRAGLAEDRRGRRTSQVVANLSAAALSVSPAAEWLLRHGLIPGVAGTIWVPDIWVPAAMKAACLAALIEATSDTLSSELGQAFGGRPVLLAGCRRVDPGTDGAVSLLGTAAGIAGGRGGRRDGRMGDAPRRPRNRCGPGMRRYGCVRRQRSGRDGRAPRLDRQ